MKKNQFIIGITGGSGVGKTTLIDFLYKTFEGRISTLSLDNYYKPKSLQDFDENGVINFDLPTALYTAELEKDLELLSNQKSIKQKVYNFNNPEKSEEYRIIESNDILLVEGLFVMHYPFVKSKLNFSVFLSVNEESQLERRLKRDVEERNYSKEDVLYQWYNHVLPAYHNFILPYKSEADLVITNNRKFDGKINRLVSVIKENITGNLS